MAHMEPTSQAESMKAASSMADRSLADRIVRTPGVRGGKPRIAGHRITVSDVAIWHERMGMSPDEIVSEFPTITLSDVHAALAYYFDHRDEIDQSIREERHSRGRCASARRRRSASSSSSSRPMLPCDAFAPGSPFHFCFNSRIPASAAGSGDSTRWRRERGARP